MAIAEYRSAAFGVTAHAAAVAAHLFGTVAVVLMLVWIFHFRGGVNFNSENENHIFNVHPFLVFFFTMLMGEAIMAFKLIPAKHNVKKLIHMTITLIAFVLGVVGISAVFKYHNDLNIQHLNTLHSWTGMGTISLFGFQWVVGFLYFVYPRAPSQQRAKIVQWHAFTGLVIFLFAVCSNLSGLDEMFIFSGLKRSKQARVVNFTGIMTLLYGVAVVLTVLLPP